MEPSLLRKWGALSELPDHDVNNIAYLVVYGHRGSDLTGKGRSVMYITKDTKRVLGAGWNSLIGWDTKGLPISPRGGVYLGTGAVEVSILKGLPIEKLAVGWHIGAALAQNKSLYIWGSTREAEPLSKGIIMFNVYENEVQAACSCSSYQKRNYERSDLYGVKLMKCSDCGEYATSATPTPHKPVKPCVLYNFYRMECQRCESLCTSVAIGKHHVNYCEKCQILPEPHEYVARTVAPIRKIYLQPSMEINDLSCGKAFCALWTSLNNVLIIGFIGNEYYEGSPNIPNKVILRGISCGGEHIAIITNLGELYTCGKGDKGQLGYNWSPSMGYVTFRKVPLQGMVAKVCCGHSTTVCLMVEGSLMCFGAGLKLTSLDNLSVNHPDSEVLATPTKVMSGNNFTDIANSHLSNRYWAKTNTSLVYTWGQKKSSTHHPKLLFGITTLMEALANEQCCLSAEVGSTDAAPPTIPLVQSVAVNSAEMYGSHKFSDLTLVLADGGFPVHKIILFSTSTYFREILEEDPNIHILNMTQYNPVAYKSLLTHYYKVPTEDLRPADLFDKYLLAVNYEETEIARDLFEKLRTTVNDDTVLTLFQRSRESNNTEILTLCETYVNLPQFRERYSLIYHGTENINP